MKRTKLLVIALCLFILGTLAWAQLDPKAQPFLDAYMASFETATMTAARDATFDTLDMTMCFTSFGGKPKTPESCTRTAIDFKHRYMMSSMPGEYGMKMVYRDGKALIKIAGMPEQMPMPQNEVRKLERSFKEIFDQLQELESGMWQADGFEFSRYDGFVHYGKAVAGEQITTKATVPSFGMGMKDKQKMTLQLIFNDEKIVIGMVTDIAGGKSLTVPTSPEAKNIMFRMMNATHYSLENGKPIQTGKLRLARYKINEPLDEVLFTLTPER